MANICSTCYQVYGDSRDLKKLENILETCRCGASLYDIVSSLGENPEGLCLRGECSYYNYSEDDGFLEICTETAWDRSVDFEYILETKFPGLTFYFFTEELGCGIYETNNPDKLDECFVEICFNDDIVSDYLHKKDIPSFVAECTGAPVKTFADVDALAEYYKENTDNYVHYHIPTFIARS